MAEMSIEFVDGKNSSFENQNSDDTVHFLTATTEVSKSILAVHLYAYHLFSQRIREFQFRKQRSAIIRALRNRIRIQTE